MTPAFRSTCLRRRQRQCQHVLLGTNEKPAAQDPTRQFASVGNENIERDALSELGDVGLGKARVSTCVGEPGRLGESREGAGQIRQVHRHDFGTTRIVWPSCRAGNDHP
jgi:hypothetical protein